VKQKNLRKWNYKVFLISSSLGYFTGGLMPFLGKYSDKLGRKPFLIDYEVS